MTSARPHTRRLLGTAGIIACFDLVAMATPASAQDRLTVDTSASIGIATNPFLAPGSTPAAISPTISVHPVWVSERQLTSLRVEGDVQGTFYNQGYGSNGSVSFRGSGMHKLSEYTTVSGALGYINTIVGTNNGVRVPVGAAAIPIGPELPNFTDPALGAIGQRQHSYQGSGDISTMLTSRDQIGMGVTASANRFGSRGGFSNLGDFNYASPNAFYSRSLSETSTVGASFSVGFSNYLGTRVSDATIYQPALTISRTVGERWTLKGSLGAAIVHLNETATQSRTTTSLNGTVDLCRRDNRLTACFTVLRQTTPSAFQGVRTQTSGTTVLGYRVNAQDNVSLSAGYSHASNPLQRIVVGGLRDGSIDFANANVRYSHGFRPALSGFVTAGYAKAFGDGVKRDANLTSQVGVTYSFSGR